jgi:hypothetical protein
MIENAKTELTLDRPVTYQIIVPGELSESWSDWIEGITVTVEREADESPVSVLIGTFDQAALQSLLRGLYALGSPLISVDCIDLSQSAADKSA